MDKDKFRVLLIVGALTVTALVIKLDVNRWHDTGHLNPIINHSEIKDTTNYEYQKQFKKTVCQK